MVAEHLSSNNTNSLNALRPMPTRASEQRLVDNKNWLIHYHLCRNDNESCKLMIDEQLTQLNGNSEFANYAKGLILRHEGKIQDSFNSFKKCLQLNPKNDDSIKQVARSLYLLGRHNLANEAFSQAKALQTKPQWDLYYSLGNCLVNLGELEQGKLLLQQSLELNRHESSYLALARVLVAQGNIQAAIEVYNAANDAFPDNANLAVDEALLLMDISQLEMAFAKLGSALALDPNCGKALLAVGALMQGHGDLDVALNKYKVAAIHAPESASLWNNLGMTFFGKKRFISAVACLKRAHNLAPFDWKVLLNLGLVHITSHQYASAFHYLSAAVSLDPNPSTVFLPLAVTLANLGDRKNCRYAFEEAVSFGGVMAGAAAINFSLFLLEEGDIPGAVVMFHKFDALQRNVPADPEVVQLANKLKTILKKGDDQEKKAP